MARRLFHFDHPDRFAAGALGEPGNRAFYLQARQDRATVTVAIEKTQVAALAQRLGELLLAVGEEDEGVDLTAAGTADAAGAPQPTGLEQPFVELFQVGLIAIGWDPEQSALLVEARPIDAAGEYPEVADDDPEGPDLVRVRLSRRQARQFTIGASALVAAGRPACPFCGQPLDPAGHFCPRMNGHPN